MYGSFINALGQNVESRWTLAQTWNDMWEANISSKIRKQSLFMIHSFDTKAKISYLENNP